MTSTAKLGPLVRLWGISTSRLPSPNASSDDLTPFLISILQEALPFIDSAAPRRICSDPGSGSGSSSSATAAATKKSPWKPKGVKKPSPADSAAAVEVSERVVGAGELETVVARALLDDKTRKKTRARLGNEVWACRRSVHADAPRQGTASWAEFVRCFRDDHAAAEEAFTPAVVATHEAMSWDCGGVGAVEIEEEEEEEEDNGGGTGRRRRCWGRFTLKVVEMRHKVGRPVLQDRTFPVLQLSATVMRRRTTAGSHDDDDDEEEGHEFVVVSIPIPDFGRAAEASRLAREKDTQVAVYVSVERVRRISLPDQSGKEEEEEEEEEEGAAGKIEWLMATASDARGVLPSWVQNVAMPGIIWKDVPLFLKWIAGERLRKDVIAKDDGPVGGGGGGGRETTENNHSTTMTTASTSNRPAAVTASEEVSDDADVTSKITAAFDGPREAEAANADVRTNAVDLK